MSYITGHILVMIITGGLILYMRYVEKKNKK